jgi:ABC-type multidrug transport system fused ATPase/permease subunit
VERIFIDGIEAILMAGLTLVGIAAVLFYLNWRLAFLCPVPFLILGASFSPGGSTVSIMPSVRNQQLSAPQVLFPASGDDVV